MPDTPASPRFPDPGDLGGVFDDFPLDANLRELYLRLRLDGAVWRSQQPEDDARLLAYAVELAAEAPAIVTIPAFDEPRAAPVTRDLRANARQRRLHALLGDARVAIVAALIVALVSVTLLQISPLALRSKAPRIGSGVTPLPTLTATATATPSPAPTATRTPTPRPTAVPWVAFRPYIAPQSDGHLINAYLLRNGVESTCSPTWIVYEVLVKYTHSKPGTFTFEWRFFDGTQQVSSVDLSDSPPVGVWTPTGSVDSFDATFNPTPGQYSATPRWGAQFVITEVNGKTLAKPIESPILLMAAPAC